MEGEGVTLPEFEADVVPLPLGEELTLSEAETETLTEPVIVALSVNVEDFV